MQHTKNIILVALGAALIWVGAIISIPVGPVPITLQTMMVVVVGMMLGPGKAALAILLYYLLGIIGIPVFAGVKSGFAAFTASPTAGFLVGFLPAAVLAGLLFGLARRCAERGRGAQSRRPAGVVPYVVIALAALLGMAVPYLFGVPWFMHYTGKTLSDSLPLVLTPFLVGDVIKTFAAALIGGSLLRFRGNSADSADFGE